MKFPLTIKKSTNPFFAKGLVHFSSCLPFVDNSRAVLIHRPRTVTGHTSIGNGHISIGFFCGMHVSSSKHFTFLSQPPKDRIVCAKCESIAVSAGLPSSDEIAGRHVCKGGVKAFKTCGCIDTKTNT